MYGGTNGTIHGNGSLFDSYACGLTTSKEVGATCLKALMNGRPKRASALLV